MENSKLAMRSIDNIVDNCDDHPWPVDWHSLRKLRVGRRRVRTMLYGIFDVFRPIDVANPPWHPLRNAFQSCLKKSQEELVVQASGPSAQAGNQQASSGRAMPQSSGNDVSEGEWIPA